ncbi:AraC family transcriptional regulator [Chlorogloeopsis sp. ULAP01]|uniref:helix-turn-helix transcriptional regulator n=1 Tax=Chlorogloeopsis sp. ULAP01 TaxID=3056483 RepID=UPI0025AB2691|nr:AraC family transcriptional regulator [Chlorogloeopsis sp. ULAP01]MDM9382665.1 AraC family transcriptional regulator [Chlorogloeopsis sp. ULAP01]
MTNTVSCQEFWEQVKSVKEYTDIENEYSEILYKYSQWFGQGNILNIELRQGFYLTLEDYQVNKNITIDYPEMEHPLGFYFQISGGINCRRYGLNCAGNSIISGSGFLPQLFHEHLSYEPYKAVKVHIEPEVFKRFMGFNDAIPSQMKHLFRKPDEKHYFHNGIVTNQMQIALQQISQCPFQGLVKRMYLESKILELIALRLQQDIEAETIHRFSHTSKKGLVDKIYYAKDILESRIDNPPSVLELAQLVGLNHHQLKQGFRKVLGHTVFGYLHNFRMEQARLLLSEGKMSVAEVANSVGYEHLGHFAGAFKQKFGTTPSACLKGKIFK